MSPYSDTKMPKLNELKHGHEIGKAPDFMRFIWAACEKCDTPRWVPYIKKTDKPKSLLCMSCGRGKQEGSGKGWSDKDGYVLDRLPSFHPDLHLARSDGSILRHRLVVSKHLGRKLQPYEHVHHLNGNKKDNRIENLKLMNGNDHLDRHRGKPYIHRIQDLERTVKVLEARIKILESSTISPQVDLYYESCGV